MELPRYQYRTSASLGPGINIGAIERAAINTAQGIERAGEKLAGFLADWNKEEREARQQAQLTAGQIELESALEGARQSVLDDPAITHDKSQGMSEAFAEIGKKTRDDFLKAHEKDDPAVLKALGTHANKLLVTHHEALNTEGRKRFIAWHEVQTEQNTINLARTGNLTAALSVVDAAGKRLSPEKALAIKQSAAQAHWLTRLDAATTVGGVNELWKGYEQGPPGLVLDVSTQNSLIKARDARVTAIKQQQEAQAEVASDNAVRGLTDLLSQNALTRAEVTRVAGLLPGGEYEKWTKIAQKAEDDLRGKQTGEVIDRTWLDFQRRILRADSVEQLQQLGEDVALAGGEGRLQRRDVDALLGDIKAAQNTWRSMSQQKEADKKQRKSDQEEQLEKRRKGVKDRMNAALEGLRDGPGRDKLKSLLLGEFLEEGQNDPDKWWKGAQRAHFDDLYPEPKRQDGSWADHLKSLRAKPTKGLNEKELAHHRRALELAQKNVELHQEWEKRRAEIMGDKK